MSGDKFLQISPRFSEHHMGEYLVWAVDGDQRLIVFASDDLEEAREFAHDHAPIWDYSIRERHLDKVFVPMISEGGKSTWMTIPREAPRPNDRTTDTI